MTGMKNLSRMKSQSFRDLQLLTEIEHAESVTQRSLATKLGIALGLTNLYLKRLVKKGYIKVTTIPRNRLKYLLTPRGIAEKTRLTYEFMSYSLQQYRHTRDLIQNSFAPLVKDDLKRIAFYGTGEAAEVAFLCLKEIGLEPTAVFNDDCDGAFLGMDVQPVESLVHEDFDRIVVTSLVIEDVTKARQSALRNSGVPQEKILILRL